MARRDSGASALEKQLQLSEELQPFEHSVASIGKFLQNDSVVQNIPVSENHRQILSLYIYLLITLSLSTRCYVAIQVAGFLLNLVVSDFEGRWRGALLFASSPIISFLSSLIHSLSTYHLSIYLSIHLSLSIIPLFHILGVIDPFAETKSPVSVSSAGLEQIHVSRIL